MLATGDPPLKYQWWVGNSPVTGATSPILAVAGARKAMHQGLYTVQVGRACSLLYLDESCTAIPANNLFADNGDDYIQMQALSC